MKTEISYTFSVDSEFHMNLNALSDILQNISKQLTKKKEWWGLEVIGFMILALETHDGDDGYFKLRKPKYKKSYKMKNPLLGDRIYEGYCELEYRFSDAAYFAWVNQTPDAIDVLRHELEQMVEALSFLPKKCSNFEFEKFKVEFIKAFDEVTDGV